MASLYRHPVFDPLDLAIIDLVYDAACVHLVANHPDHDPEDDGWQLILRKRLFALAEPGPVEFDALWERALGNMTEHLLSRSRTDQAA
jgi:hypothetical protein